MADRNEKAYTVWIVSGPSGSLPYSNGRWYVLEDKSLLNMHFVNASLLRVRLTQILLLNMAWNSDSVTYLQYKAYTTSMSRKNSV